MIRRCWYGLDGPPSLRCSKPGLWRYTSVVLDRERLPRDAVWCDEHAESLKGDVERLPATESE